MSKSNDLDNALMPKHDDNIPPVCTDTDSDVSKTDNDDVYQAIQFMTRQNRKSQDSLRMSSMEESLQVSRV